MPLPSERPPKIMQRNLKTLGRLEGLAVEEGGAAWCELELAKATVDVHKIGPGDVTNVDHVARLAAGADDGFECVVIDRLHACHLHKGPLCTSGTSAQTPRNGS